MAKEFNKIGPYDVLATTTKYENDIKTDYVLATDKKTIAWVGGFALAQAYKGDFRYIKQALAYRHAVTYGTHIKSQELVERYNEDEHFRNYIDNRAKELNRNDRRSLVDLNVENAQPVGTSLRIPVNVIIFKENGERRKVRENAWMPQSMMSTNPATGETKIEKWALLKQIGVVCRRIRGEVSGEVKSFLFDKRQISSEISNKPYGVRVAAEMEIYGIPKKNQVTSPFKYITHDPVGVERDYNQFTKDEKAREKAEEFEQIRAYMRGEEVENKGTPAGNEKTAQEYPDDDIPF